MTADEDLAAWLREQLDEDDQAAKAATPGPWHAQDGGVVNDDDDQWPVSRTESDRDRADRVHIAGLDPSWRLADIARKRQILDEHAPQLRTVEWDHDQNGKGEALCCPRCQNAEHSEWNPPLGQARGLPDGFVTPYVLAPCRTLRLLAEEFAGEPGYDAERWAP